MKSFLRQLNRTKLRLLSVVLALFFIGYSHAVYAQACGPTPSGPGICSCILTTYGIYPCPDQDPNTAAADGCFWTCDPPTTVSDPVTDASTVAGWAAKAAQYLKEAVQWIQDNTFGLAKQIQTYINAQLSSVLTQAKVDGEIRAQMADANADANDKFNPGTLSPACALTRARQESSQATATTLGMLTGFERYGVGPGAGQRGNTKGSKYFIAEWNDICMLGFLDTNNQTNRYGNATQGCTDLSQNYPQYIDADYKLSSVIGKLQYPLPAPAHWQRTRDGHVSFYVSQGNSVTPQEIAPGLGSEMDFAAAWKFCEHLQPTIPSPTINAGNFTAADVASIVADRQAVATRTGASEECFRAIAYRTSCSAAQQGNSNLNNTAHAQGGAQPPQPNCYTAQQKVCTRLTSPLFQGGLGLTLANDDPVYSSALRNCATTGLSQAMTDALMARICDDDNYSNTVLPSVMGDSPKIEKSISTACKKKITAFEQRLERENTTLSEAVDAFNKHNLNAASGKGAKTQVETP